LANATSLFVAANPFTQTTPVSALVVLRGNGTVYMKSSTNSSNGIHDGYLFNYFNNFGPDPVDNPSLDYTAALAVGEGSTYDGFNLTPTPESNKSGEGQHVLDVEGKVKVVSVSNDTTCGRTYLPAVKNAGVLNMASILRDFRGNEIYGITILPAGKSYGDPLLRPLTLNTPYARYNSPAMWFNNFMELFNSILLHSDATKYVDGIPNLSEPSMTGGERFFYAVNFWGTAPSTVATDPDRYRFPEIRFYNSEFQIQESCNLSGVRAVVTDLGSGSPEGDNTTIFRFYDHGDQLDTALTGFGRVLMFGSSLNLMADSCTIDGLPQQASSNWATDSAYCNVFRHSLTPGYQATASAVTLKLKNGNQFLPDVNPKLYDLERAQHLFMFSQPASEFASTSLRISWPTIVGDASPFPSSYPYPYPAGVPYPSEIMSTNPADLFSLDALTVTPAVVLVDGHFICFGSFNCAGQGTKVPVATGTDCGIVYVDHGGKLSITRPATSHYPPDFTSKPYETIIATTIANKLWNDYDLAGTKRDIWLTGDVDLPHDQSTFDQNELLEYTVQPYGLTLDMFAARRAITEGYVRVSYDNGNIRYPNLPPMDLRQQPNDASGAEQVSFGWFYRDFDLKHFVPVKDITKDPKKVEQLESIKSALKSWTRATEIQKELVKRPVDLLYIGAGDDITQMIVYGATPADPFELDVSGSGEFPLVARVREFVSGHTTNKIAYDHFIGEGAHAVLFGEFDGRIGLGSRSWNARSLYAWNLLGKDYVSICPLGNMTVDVNSDLIVTDRGAFIACENFGREFSPTNTNAPFSPANPGFYGEDQQLTFISTEEHTITVPAHGELNFAAFGRTLPKRNKNNQPGENAKQIVSFAGSTAVVLEEGTTLRLPDNPSKLADGSPAFILYFNDQSQLICQAAKDATPFLEYKDTYYGPYATQLARIKIVGQGQIWFNKDAKFIVNGNTMVAVQSDAINPTTNVTVSLQRQGSWYIGTQTVSGGSFEVGNPLDFNVINPHTRAHVSQIQDIQFNLLVNGANALVHLDREAFLGFGAGVVNKHGNPNGSANVSNNPEVDAAGNAVIDNNGFPKFHPDDHYNAAKGHFNSAWQIRPLFNVSAVNVQITQGTFEHSNIGDGSSSNGSLMALGPIQPIDVYAPANGFTFAVNSRESALVHGGGNLMLVPAVGNISPDFFANIWDYAGLLPNGEMYSVLASAPLLLDRTALLGGGTINPFGNGGKVFNGTSANMFNFLAQVPFSQQGRKKIDMSSTQFQVSAVYIDSLAAKYAGVTAGPSALIVRFDDPAFTGGSIYDALETGALNATAASVGANANIPTNFTIIR